MPKSQLLELYAHGLGVIDDARLEFGAGFNVLTGETGAGKTLLLGALDLCLGGDGSVTRAAIAPDMRAAAVFDLNGEREIVLTRESGASGRLRSAVDGASSSAEALRAFAEQLIVIHGQHDSLTLRHRAEVLRLIDAKGGVSTQSLTEARRALRSTNDERASLGGDAEERTRELDFVEFQIAELTAAAIRSAGELDETLEELTRLTELRDGQAALGEVLDQLDADGEVAVLAQFARAISRLPEGEAYDPARTALRGALEQSRDAVHDLASLSDPESFDPAALKELDDRATVLQALVRKYGSLGDALATLEALRTRHLELSAASERTAVLDADIDRLRALVATLADETRHEREVAAAALSDAVAGQLTRVALAHARLRFVVAGDDGSDAQILFTPNPGQPEGPLQALASGGELSRVLLALSLESAHEDVVAVFDEVDAGVGGQVAQQIGDCLRELGAHQQVLAVTHLASVAAKADHHFVIEKTVGRDDVRTTVRSVRGEERVDEIARMLAGDDITDESRALARRMLETLS
ncbi:MAG: AAA family ATPase [Acidimicrobiales bacterium]